MAVATGTAALVGAGLSAAGVLGSSAMQNSAAKRAAAASERATADALAFEREKYTAGKAERDAAQAAYQQRWDAWNNTRMALLRGKFPKMDFGGGAAPSYAVPGRAPAGMPAAAIPVKPTAAMSIPAGSPMAGTPMGALLSGGDAGAPVEEPPEGADEFDWRAYGVR